MEVLNLRTWARGPLFVENDVACNHYEGYQPPQNLGRLTEIRMHISVKSRFVL
jgi:hypothetical protein